MIIIIDIKYADPNLDGSSEFLGSPNSHPNMIENIENLSDYDDEVIKIALSYSLCSDETWNSIHGTDQVDIANWQYENLAAAKVVINLVYDKVMANEPLTPEELEKMGAIIHDEWLKRNSWVFDSNYGNPKLAVPYDQLPKEEQEKNKLQARQAYRKVKACFNGAIDIGAICEQYGIEQSGKSL